MSKRYYIFNTWTVYNNIAIQIMINHCRFRYLFIEVWKDFQFYPGLSFSQTLVKNYLSNFITLSTVFEDNKKKSVRKYIFLCFVFYIVFTGFWDKLTEIVPKFSRFGKFLADASSVAIKCGRKIPPLSTSRRCKLSVDNVRLRTTLLPEHVTGIDSFTIVLNLSELMPNWLRKTGTGGVLYRLNLPENIYFKCINVSLNGNMLSY